MKKQTIRITLAAVLFCALQVSVALPNATGLTGGLVDSTRTDPPAKATPAVGKPTGKKVINDKKAKVIPQYQWFYIPKTKKDNC